MSLCKMCLFAVGATIAAFAALGPPVFGSSRPSLFAACPVYQSEPSGASAGPCGRDLGVGTSYSLICAVSAA
jgi:hypothetical protein